MEKKNPFVMTVGFKKDDPDHVYVAGLLNAMGRGKAQYIVKAVLAYREMPKREKAFWPMDVPLSYENIKQIVLQVIEERERQNGKTVDLFNKEETQLMQEKENDLLEEFDEYALSDIMASIEAFREQ